MEENPMHMNNQKIDKVIVGAIAIQLIMVAIIVLGALGFEIPVLRQIIGFVYLSFLPGLLLLRILRPHKFEAAETVVYTVALSLAFNMFIGFFMNILYPLIGITRPMFTEPIIITWAVILGGLSIIAFKRKPVTVKPVHINIGTILSPPSLLLIALPVISILGAISLNFNQTGTIPIQLLFLALIAAVVALIVLGKYFPQKLYIWALFSITISLLFHYSLGSLELAGRDSRLEYYIHSLVVTNGIWQPDIIDETYNAMISVGVLPAIFSFILNIDGKWVFLVIWPAFCALIPLGLYHVYKRQVTEKKAFLAAFYLVIILVFYSMITSIPRQEIGMLFLTSIILLLTTKDMDLLKKTALIVSFTIGVVVSHYTISYLFMMYSVATFILLFFLKARDSVIKANFVLLLVVSTLGWYIYSAKSSAFADFVLLGEHMATSFVAEIFNFQSREAATVLAMGEEGFLHYLHFGLLLLMQAFISIGILKLIFEYRKKKTPEEYDIFCFISFCLLAGSVVIPYLSDTISLQRLYVITLLFLAPFCISGAELTIRLAGKFIAMVWESTSVTLSWLFRKKLYLMTSEPVGGSENNPYSRSSQGKVFYGIMSSLLIVLFLLASDFIYVLANKPIESHSLNNSGEDIWSWFTPAEVKGGLWLLEHRDRESQLMCDVSGRNFFLAYRGFGYVRTFAVDKNTLQLFHPVGENAYIYLRRYNINHGIIMIHIGPPEIAYATAHKRRIFRMNVDDLVSLKDRNKIYFNGGAVIYKEAKRDFQ